MNLFTIFGDPVSHSISPLLHNNVIKNLNLNACYTRTLLKDGNEIINIFKKLKLNGANVTVPHKEIAFKLCDEIRGIANDIKAVNTMIDENGKIIGYNTDAPGFYHAIESLESIENALILGAGGTAKAIAFILNKHDIKVTILNRSSNRLDFFIQNGFKSYSWNDFKIDKFNIIINTTPAGLKDNNLPLDKKLLDALMQKASFVFDVIYGKDTPFLQLAGKNKLTCKDGSNMLLYQGALAFNLFYKNKFDLSIIEKYMNKSLTLS